MEKKTLWLNDTINGGMEDFSSLNDLLGYVDECFTDPVDGVHPDINSLRIYKEVGCIRLEETGKTKKVDNIEYPVVKVVAELDKKHCWQPVAKDSDYDGTYLAYIEKTEECGAINHYQRTVFNKKNKWVLEPGESLLYWMGLPDVPNQKEAPCK